MVDLLESFNYSKHSKPKKLIVMLHGYGDNAKNFLYLSQPLDKIDWNAYYLALNAPEFIPNYPMGYQWFDLYPNGIYIADAGPEENKIITKSVLSSLKKIEITIKFHLKKLNLTTNDCIVLGFSQGGMMTFEFGNFLNEQLGSIIILSGRIMQSNFNKNKFFKETPIFISHGTLDDVIPIKNFHDSVNYLKNKNFNFESHEIREDTHTISPKAIDLLQKFIKKNL
tara:strand:- start:2204 stop:2878 length:675 start_codon:yes stop_codon:yes gene_type:complete